MSSSSWYPETRPRCNHCTYIATHEARSSHLMTDFFPLRLILATFAGWVNRHQAHVIDYLVEENRVLEEQLGTRRLRLTDDQRRLCLPKTSSEPDESQPDQPADHDTRVGVLRCTAWDMS